MQNINKKFLFFLLLAITGTSSLFSMEKKEQIVGKKRKLENRGPYENEPPRKKHKALRYARLSLSLNSTQSQATQDDRDPEEKETENCGVCLDQLTDNTKTLVCIHKFHKPCINRWLMRSKTCPLCKAKVEDNFMPTQEETAKIEKINQEDAELQREREQQGLGYIEPFPNHLEEEDSLANIERSLLQEFDEALDISDNNEVTEYTDIENQEFENEPFFNCRFHNCTLRNCILLGCIIGHGCTLEDCTETN